MRNHRRNKRNGNNLLKGLIAGVVGGLVASWTMDRFQSLWSGLSKIDDKSAQQEQEASGNEKQRDQEAHKPEQKTQSDGEKEEQAPPATVKVAMEISESFFAHKLTPREKRIAGPAVHYAMGATSGAIYGVMSEMAPLVKVGAGLPFGAMVWLIADEAALPALNISKSPTEYPLSTHAYALVSHFVYGATTELMRGFVRRLI